jgi:hypothetical protein
MEFEAINILIITQAIAIIQIVSLFATVAAAIAPQIFSSPNNI